MADLSFSVALTGRRRPFVDWWRDRLTNDLWFTLCHSGPSIKPLAIRMCARLLVKSTSSAFICSRLSVRFASRELRAFWVD